MKDEKAPHTVGKLIPAVLAVGAALASWKLLGGAELLDELAKKELQDEYDYVIGKYASCDVSVMSVGNFEL